MYSPGEIIVHPLHGAGRIEEIVEQKVAGEIRKYYVLQIPTDHVRVMVPVDGCEHIGIRPAVTAEEARDILAAFAKIEVEPEPNWNRRYRENMLRLKSGKLEEVSRVVKSLMVRDAEHKLSTGERKMLATARRILLSELVLATDEPYEALERALEAGLSL